MGHEDYKANLIVSQIS